jgi:hypothetical protein
MAVRKDNIQISIDIEASKGVKEYQKLLDESKKNNNEMRRLKRAGKETSEEFIKLKKRSAELSKEFKKVGTSGAKWGQLNTRARELEKTLKYGLVPGTKEFVAASKELKRVRTRMAELNDEVRGTAKGMEEVRIAGVKVPQGIVKAFVALQFLAYFRELFQIVDATTQKFIKLRGEVAQTTGASGEVLDQYASRIAALAATFKKPEEELLAATTALSEQLDGDFSRALDNIEKGFLAGADRSGDFLNQVKEYPAFFREMELSGEQMIAVISQGVTSGVFGDKAPDALKEFLIRVREMPKATREAFEAIGTDSEEIRRKIDEDGIGGAFTLVQEKLQKLEDDSPVVGQALADIFGGPGEDAGIQFIKQLDLTEGALDRLIDQSNEYTAKMEEQLRANEELTEAQNRIAKGFKDTSNSLSVYITRIKTFLFNVGADVLEFFEELPATGAGVAAALKQVGQNFKNFFENLLIEGKIALKKIEALNPFGKTSKQLQQEIIALQARQIELQDAGRSAGEAYREAYLEGLADVEQRKKVSETILKNISPTDEELKDQADKDAQRQLDAKEKALAEAIAKRKAQSTPVAQLGRGERAGEVIDGGATAVASQGTNIEAEEAILKNKFLKALLTEQEYEDQRYELLQQNYARRLELLGQKYGEESLAYKNLENEKLQHQKDYEAQRTELAKRSAEFRQQLDEQTLSSLSELAGATIELLQGEEGERKKNSLALKAFSAAKVIIDTEEAIMAIIKNAQANPANILFPGAGNLISGLKIAAVTAKSVAALNKIRNTGFYEGGHTGSQGLFMDTRGRQVVGAVHQNEWVAPEWMVRDGQYGQIINYLETMRKRGFEDGGFTAAPAFGISAQGSAAGGSAGADGSLERMMGQLISSQRQMAEAVRRKQFAIYTGQVADALDEEYRLREKSGF